MERAMSEPCDLTAVEARRLIGMRKLSPVELAESCLKRTSETNGTVNAVVAQDEKLALATAKRFSDLDFEAYVGPAGDDHPHLVPQHRLQCVGEHPGDGAQPGLDGPPGEVGAVVADVQAEPRRRILHRTSSRESGAVVRRDSLRRGKPGRSPDTVGPDRQRAVPG